MFKPLASLSAASLLALGACAPTPSAQPVPVEETPVIVDVDAGPQCRHEDWQSYVGKPRQSLPAAPEGMVFRVLCKDCVATMDYRSNRVTFTYDDNDVITRANCG